MKRSRTLIKMVVLIKDSELQLRMLSSQPLSQSKFMEELLKLEKISQMKRVILFSGLANPFMKIAVTLISQQ